MELDPYTCPFSKVLSCPPYFQASKYINVYHGVSVYIHDYFLSYCGYCIHLHSSQMMGRGSKIVEDSIVLFILLFSIEISM